VIADSASVHDLNEERNCHYMIDDSPAHCLDSPRRRRRSDASAQSIIHSHGIQITRPFIISLFHNRQFSTNGLATSGQSVQTGMHVDRDLQQVILRRRNFGLESHILRPTLDLDSHFSGLDS